MPFFAISINTNKGMVLGSNDYKYLEVGLISVGPELNTDLLGNAVNRNSPVAVNLVTGEICCGDVINIHYYDNNDINPTFHETLQPHFTTRENGLNKCTNRNIRKYKINIDDRQTIQISARKDFTLSLNCTWTLKDNKCKVTLGNTDYNDNEQWFQTYLKSGQNINIIVE